MYNRPVKVHARCPACPFFHTSSTDFLTTSKCGLDEPQFEPPKDVVLMLKNVNWDKASELD